MNEQFASVGRGVELCYETFGDPGDPAMLMVMGLATQMLGWRAEFCEQLANRGFFVIRYDNRDTGRSTRFDDVPPPTPLELLTRRIRRPAYTLDDMADDGIGLLDALGIDTAHVVGASMGGMLAQTMAIRHPRRVRSLVSIMSTTGARWKGQPALRILPIFFEKPPATREASIERTLRVFSLVGSRGYRRDEEGLRDMAARSWDRGPAAAGSGRQLAAVLTAGDRTRALAGIAAPTLVIHGTDDRMVTPSGGQATAEAIPGARLLIVEGMGHDLPRGAWPLLVGAIAQNAARAPRDDHREAAAA